MSELLALFATGAAIGYLAFLCGYVFGLEKATGKKVVFLIRK